jgi:dTDP-4-amino-4,6-dideoxygalactose transaminase
MNAYSVVEEFERRVADYAGAKYGVAVNSCTNALLLSFAFRFHIDDLHRWIRMPKRTYVGVAQAVLAAGGVCDFSNEQWSGAYAFQGMDDAGVRDLGVVDSARRFRAGMFYEWGSDDLLYCVSFHWYKHVPVGAGGMILTNSELSADILRVMRYDGRIPELPVHEQEYDVPAWHCLMPPEDATRGLLLMDSVADYNQDLPWDGYDDLSRHDMFKRGWR